MTDIDKAKAVLAVCANPGIALSASDRVQIANSLRAMIAKAEQADQFEAFKRQVSDAASRAVAWADKVYTKSTVSDILAPLILPKPVDPLVEALNDMKDGRAGETTESYAACLRLAIEARGGKIVWDNEP